MVCIMRVNKIIIAMIYKQTKYTDQWNITDILEIDPNIWLVDFQQRR